MIGVPKIHTFTVPVLHTPCTQNTHPIYPFYTPIFKDEVKKM